MDIKRLKRFFMWCTILNGGLLIFMALMVILVPNRIYNIQSQWFSISRDTFNIIIFAFLGLFKIFFFVFNLVPYIALCIIDKKKGPQ